MINKNIGAKLRNLRLKQGLSQQNVADDLGLSATAYSKIENGRTNLSVNRLHQLADYYCVFVADLLDPRRDLPRPVNEVDDLTEKEYRHLNQYFAGILSSVHDAYSRGK